MAKVIDLEKMRYYARTWSLEGKPMASRIESSTLCKGAITRRVNLQRRINEAVQRVLDERRDEWHASPGRQRGEILLDIPIGGDEQSG